MTTALIMDFIIFSLLGSVVASVVAMIGRFRGVHVLSSGLLMLATASGVVGAISALIYFGAGNALPPSVHFFGISIAVNGLSLIFSLIINMVSFLVALYGIAYLQGYEKTYHVRFVDILTALFVFSMQILLFANTPFGFILLWEAMSMTSFFLVMADREDASIKAALFYLIMTHLGAGALIAGFAIVSGGNFSLPFIQIQTLALGLSPAMSSIAFGLFLFGFGAKAGLVPFHAWLPDAHPQAPSHVSALMSGAMLKIAVYGFLLVSLNFFPKLSIVWAIVIIIAGLLSAVYGVLYAIVEHDIKRILAYSSIENIGLIFTYLGVAMLASSLKLGNLAYVAFAVAILHSFFHALFKTGLFLSAGAIIKQMHTRSLELMGGLAKRTPAFSVVCCVLVLGAAALPPLGAFPSEWLFMQEIVSSLLIAPISVRLALVAILSVLSLVAGLAVFAMVKLFAIVFLGEPRSKRASQMISPPLGLLIPIYATGFLSAFAGIFSPIVLKLFGINGLVRHDSFSENLATSAGTISPSLLMLFFIGIIGVVVLVRRFFSDKKNERFTHTWNCGQPISSLNEYTATAFAGPIRFFFHPLLHIRKTIITQQISLTNRWFTSKEYALVIRSIWYDYLYAPLGRTFQFIAGRVRKIQNGVIQFYIALILAALVVTLFVGL